LTEAESFVGSKEEELLFEDRAADSAAELVAVEERAIKNRSSIIVSSC